MMTQAAFSRDNRTLFTWGQLLERMTDKDKKILYSTLWGKDLSVNKFVEQAPLKNTPWQGKPSLNSLSFADERGVGKKELLKDLFQINDQNLFDKKFDMACGGSGSEYNRITVLHSSSLCALLFFYNITGEHPLTIPGVGTFYASTFEVKTPVIHNPSNMDVVLLGKEEDGKPVVLFLESKFSEYWMNTGTTLNDISMDYYTNPFSHPFYPEWFQYALNTESVEGKAEDGNDVFQLKSTEPSYLEGLKQLISHYVGIRNTLQGDKVTGWKPKDLQKEVIQATQNPEARVYLGTILFDYKLWNLPLANGVRCGEDYAKRYQVLAWKMNAEIRKANLAGRFQVLPLPLGYSSFIRRSSPTAMDTSNWPQTTFGTSLLMPMHYDGTIESNVSKFYFGA